MTGLRRRIRLAGALNLSPDRSSSQHPAGTGGPPTSRVAGASPLRELTAAADGSYGVAPISMQVLVRESDSAEDAAAFSVSFPVKVFAPLSAAAEIGPPIIGYPVEIPVIQRSRVRARSLHSSLELPNDALRRFRTLVACGNAPEGGGVGDRGPIRLESVSARGVFDSGTVIDARIGRDQGLGSGLRVKVAPWVPPEFHSVGRTEASSPVIFVSGRLSRDGRSRGFALAVPLPRAIPALDFVDARVSEGGCAESPLRLKLRVETAEGTSAADRAARGAAIRLVVREGTLAVAGKSVSLPDPLPPQDPDGFSEVEFPVSGPAERIDFVLATVAGTAGVIRKVPLCARRAEPGYQLEGGRFTPELGRPVELELKFRRHRDLAARAGVGAAIVRVRSPVIPVGSRVGEWVEARVLSCSADETWFAVPVGVAADFRGSIEVDVQLEEGGRPGAQWHVAAVRSIPPSQRLVEARTALIGGIVFAQKFRFASVVAGLGGIGFSILLKFPIGVVVGILEAAVLFIMPDAFYLRHLQRRSRWW